MSGSGRQQPAVAMWRCVDPWQKRRSATHDWVNSTTLHCPSAGPGRRKVAAGESPESAKLACRTLACRFRDLSRAAAKHFPDRHGSQQLLARDINARDFLGKVAVH
jgi:hypothetical protein